MTGHELGDAPITPAYRKKMQKLARAVDLYLNGYKTGNARDTGFVLLVFPFGDAEGNRCNFISNGADRKDIEPQRCIDMRQIAAGWFGAR